MKVWEVLQQDSLGPLEQAFREAQLRYVEKSPMREMLDYHFSSGGKRLRPLLAIGAALAYARKKGGDEAAVRRNVMPYALAVELVHNATLIHDDLQDGDKTRRGQPTIWVKYGPAQAINCGDAWFHVPQLLVLDSDYAPGLKLELLGLLQRKTLAVIDGQAQEFALKERFHKGEEISIHQYLLMVEGKTSALFSMPLLGGALVAGAGALERKALEQSSLHLGHAFQIQDDLLDLWGDKGRGQAGCDIAEGKLSYPFVLLLAKLGRGTENRKRAEAILRAPRENTPQSDIDWVISLMEKEGIKDQALADFKKHLKEARLAQFWDEVLGGLADWLESSVARF